MFERSDEALFGALVGGDLSAFDVLYQRYERPLFGFVRRQVGDSDAEDVIHETFLNLLRQPNGARHATSFRAWVFTVARHLCLNRARTTKRSLAAVASIEAEPAPAAETPELTVELRQRSHQLERALASLPGSAAELYHLRVRGLSYEELADVLDVPVGTIKSRLHDLVRRLREELAS